MSEDAVLFCGGLKAPADPFSGERGEPKEALEVLSSATQARALFVARIPTQPAQTHLEDWRSDHWHDPLEFGHTNAMPPSTTSQVPRAEKECRRKRVG